MDEITANRLSLRTIIAAFRAAAAYYMKSDDPRASEARSRLAQVTQGTDPFFAAFFQDLDDVHTSLEFEPLWGSAGWVDASREFHNLLPWLAILFKPKDEQQEACDAPFSIDGSVKSLLALCNRTSSWNFDGLEPTKIEFLFRRIDLRDPPLQLREGLKRALEAAIPYIQPSDIKAHGEEGGTSSSWALRAAIKLCEPLRGVHETLLGEWFCECPTRHTRVLASFAAPCFTQNSGVHCILRFPLGESWNTVFLDVKDERVTLDAIASSDTSDLHDELSAQNVTTARLIFSPTARRWSLEKEDEHPARQRDMVALADLIALDGTQALHEQASYTHRVSLALLIAYAFLELGDSPWLPYTTDHINIWLPYLAGSTPDLLQPYIEVGLDTTNQILDDSRYRLLRLVNPSMPCLPLLGKLIFELISGNSVRGIEDIEQLMPRYFFHNPDRAVHVSGAVFSCISDLDFRQGMIRDDERLRKAFIERVIDRLNALLKACPDKDLETVLRMSQHKTTQQPSLLANRVDSVTRDDLQLEKQELDCAIVEPKSGYCLHDNEFCEPYDAHK
jgi:hypothetical protein